MDCNCGWNEHERTVAQWDRVWQSLRNIARVVIALPSHENSEYIQLLIMDQTGTKLCASEEKVILNPDPMQTEMKMHFYMTTRKFSVLGALLKILGLKCWPWTAHNLVSNAAKPLGIYKNKHWLKTGTYKFIVLSQHADGSWTRTLHSLQLSHFQA